MGQGAGRIGGSDWNDGEMDGLDELDGGYPMGFLA